MEFHIPPGWTSEPYRLATGPVNWGMAACTVDKLRELGRGKGEIICVLDTGVNRRHPELIGREHMVESHVPGESIDDGHSHGSNVTGIACSSNPNVGVAYEAAWMHGKVLSNRGSGLDTWIYKGVKWGMENGATHINLSIGGDGPSNPQMDELFNECERRGIRIWAASGNERQQGGRTTYPARYRAAFAVAAMQESGAIAPFSNPGWDANTLAILTPGTNAPGCAPSGSGHTIQSGSSMSSPWGSGSGACIDSARAAMGLLRWTNAEMRQFLYTRAVDHGKPGADVDSGPGRFSGAMAFNGLMPDPPAVQ